MPENPRRRLKDRDRRRRRRKTALEQIQHCKTDLNIRRFKNQLIIMGRLNQQNKKHHLNPLNEDKRIYSVITREARINGLSISELSVTTEQPKTWFFS